MKDKSDISAKILIFGTIAGAAWLIMTLLSVPLFLYSVLCLVVGTILFNLDMQAGITSNGLLVIPMFLCYIAAGILFIISLFYSPIAWVGLVVIIISFLISFAVGAPYSE